MDRYTDSKVHSVSTRDIEAFCKGLRRGGDDLGLFFRRIKHSKDGVSSAEEISHPKGVCGGRVDSCLDSPWRAGMAFHTDTGPWLANWPRDTSRKKIGNPASASIIR